MNKALLAALIICGLLLSLVVGLQAVEEAKANFFPGDALILHSPHPKVVYTNTSVPFEVVANVANPTPEVKYIIYSLDGNSNVTLTNLNKTLRIAGHIDGSQFGAYLFFENLAEGNHTLEVYSQDASGKQMFASVEFVIDTQYTSPLTVISPQNMTYTTIEVPLTFICREDKEHDGNFTRAIFALDGMGSNYIYENLTLTDLSIGSHTIEVVAWTKNGFFSEKIFFTVSNQTSTATPFPPYSPTQQPTIEPSPIPTLSPNPSPTIPEYPTWILVPLVLATTLLILCKRKMGKQ